MDDWPRAIVFDLDRTVIDRRRAWTYALEEAIAMTTGERPRAEPLAAEYMDRPWSHVTPILLHDRERRAQCDALCERYFRRSALKHLLVFDGIGMTLDDMRGQRIALGAVSRDRHFDAMRQMESTGVDRFFTVLSPTPEGRAWDVEKRIRDCVVYLERRSDEIVYVAGSVADRERAEQAGVFSVLAGWTNESPGEGPGHPADLLTLLRRRH